MVPAYAKMISSNLPHPAVMMKVAKIAGFTVFFVVVFLTLNGGLKHSLYQAGVYLKSVGEDCPTCHDGDPRSVRQHLDMDQNTEENYLDDVNVADGAEELDSWALPRQGRQGDLPFGEDLSSWSQESASQPKRPSSQETTDVNNPEDIDGFAEVEEVERLNEESFEDQAQSDNVDEAMRFESGSVSSGSSSSTEAPETEAPRDVLDDTVGELSMAVSKNEESRAQARAPAPSQHKLVEAQRNKISTAAAQTYAGEQQVTKLQGILEEKLSRATTTISNVSTKFCSISATNSCKPSKCMQKEVPISTWSRVEQLVGRSNLKLSDVNRKKLEAMKRNLKGAYDIILLAATSESQYGQFQALLKNLHSNVFPHLKNFTLVVYDIGLSAEQRLKIKKYCRCQLLNFPFSDVPEYISDLTCYAWRPLIIKAHIQQAKVLLWLDLSVRFPDNTANFMKFVARARLRGAQIGAGNHSAPLRTLQSMYQYFGDEPCAYMNYGQAEETFMAFSNEYLVNRGILEPWVTCAFKKECICPAKENLINCNKEETMAHNFFRGKGHLLYGMCHKYDLSAISLIVHKMFREYYRWVLVRANDFMAIKRGGRLDYFKDLAKYE